MYEYIRLNKSKQYDNFSLQQVSTVTIDSWATSTFKSIDHLYRLHIDFREFVEVASTIEIFRAGYLPMVIGGCVWSVVGELWLNEQF